MSILIPFSGYTAIWPARDCTTRYAMCPAKDYTLRYGPKAAICHSLVWWFKYSGIQHDNVPLWTARIWQLSEVLLISSNEVLSHVFAIVRMASRGPPFQTPLTISHGQPQTGDSTSTHMVSHRLEVPHQFIWSAFHYATRPLQFIKQLESTTLKGKIPQTAEFRRQRHGQVHPGATGGSTIPDASAAV